MLSVLGGGEVPREQRPIGGMRQIQRDRLSQGEPPNRHVFLRLGIRWCAFPRRHAVQMILAGAVAFEIAFGDRCEVRPGRGPGAQFLAHLADERLVQLLAGFPVAPKRSQPCG